MDNKPRISGFVIMSEPDKLRYPYMESVKSFLPLCDEINVVYNILKPDNSLEKLQNLDPKVKVIYGLFDYSRFGWASQGIMRTNGYYASTGDIVLMFDADGILHENDVEKARLIINQMYNNKVAYGFWMKHRINQREKGVRQCKHSGIYNKSILGNNFNFYGGTQNYRPMWELLPEEHKRAQNTDIYLYGYERCWDNKKIFEMKLKDRKIMEGSKMSDQEYIDNFIQERIDKVDKEGYLLPILSQPKIIQEKLREIESYQFGYNLFQELK